MPTETITQNEEAQAIARMEAAGIHTTLDFFRHAGKLGIMASDLLGHFSAAAPEGFTMSADDAEVWNGPTERGEVWQIRSEWTATEGVSIAVTDPIGGKCEAMTPHQAVELARALGEVASIHV